MPRMDGIEATRRLARAASTARVLVLTTFDLDEYVYEALRAGAAGFMLKDAPPQRLADAVRTVAARRDAARARRSPAASSSATRPSPRRDLSAFAELDAARGRTWSGSSRAACRTPRSARELFLSGGDGQDAPDEHPAQGRPARPDAARRARVRARARAARATPACSCSVGRSGVPPRRRTAPRRAGAAPAAAALARGARAARRARAGGAAGAGPRRGARACSRARRPAGSRSRSPSRRCRACPTC